ncbi:MAG: hypothetical protein K2X41_01990 [Hyphomicrobium sp.]|nr:hypothetical protein [Hyphomicrobium sp.]
MTLDDIAEIAATPARPTVPAWAFGTVVRQSITFATGAIDTTTRVRWVQSHAMTGDIRVHAARPHLTMADRLDDLDADSLVLLASVEGGTATTAWAAGTMSWSDWIGFQPYDKYPESGLMHRIGPCMIEFAPSGIYVEDWRFQPSAPGLLAGLRLIAEVDDKGAEHARAGGLVIAGDHALRAVARRHELPSGTRAQDFVRASPNPLAAVQQVLDCTVDYAIKRQGNFTIETSTDPRREGSAAHFASDFTPTSTPGVISQRVTDCPGIARRLWRIDSLEASVSFSLSTPAPSDKLAWLTSEADTLLAPISTQVT